MATTDVQRAKHAAYMRNYLATHPDQKAKSDARWANHQKNHKRRLRELVNREKSRPCADCGVQFNPWVMQFDHRNPAEKLGTIADLVSQFKAEKIVLAEIAKCDVVCANCHAERTHDQRMNHEI